jgi:Zn-finger nucleic acid-binding protein
MAEQSFEGNYGATVALDICHACNSLWFDDKESLQLTPGSTLRLFTIIHEKQARQRQPLRDPITCPRCRTRLASVIDAQRGVRFSYARCPRGHGRFITFFEFLREKNFVRPLTAKQLSELRKHLTAVNCSNCGAPVDLNTGSSCGFCRTPLSLLDAKQLEATVRELQQAEQKRKTIDPTLSARLLMDKLRADRVYGPGPADVSRLVSQPSFGLVEAGLEAVVGLLKTVV